MTIRRHLHQYPELSLKEQTTSEYCQGQLKELGYHINASFGFGFCADLIIDNSLPMVALRADMDALPIQEKNSHDYVSKHDHVAHMCGHDAHMTIALIAAELIKSSASELKCNVRFLFQPSEETPPGGALGMIAKGALDGVDEVFGLHNDPGLEVGTIRTRAGGFLAAADCFEVVIQGRGGHAARPHKTLDPVYVGAELITQWQSIISRQIDPAHCAVLSVTQFHAGDIFNVIPDNAILSGTVRTFFPEDRNLIQQSIEDSFSTYQKTGFHLTLNYQRGYDAVVNHTSGVKRVAKAAAKVVGNNQVITDTDPVGWGEDFCYFLQKCSGAFYLLGSGNNTKGITQDLHSSQFDIDESCLAIGAAIMAQLVFDF